MLSNRQRAMERTGLEPVTAGLQDAEPRRRGEAIADRANGWVSATALDVAAKRENRDPA